MKDFIWLGDRLVNPAHIAYFEMEEEPARVVAHLVGVAAKDSVITIDGENAEAVISVLNQTDTGLPSKYGSISSYTSDLGSIPMNVDLTDDPVVEISDPRAVRE